MDNYYRALTLPELLLPICLSELGKVLTMSDLAPRFLRQHLLRCFLTTPLARAIAVALEPNSDMAKWSHAV